MTAVPQTGAPGLSGKGASRGRCAALAIAAAIVFALGLAGCIGCAAGAGRPAVVILLRHAEKPGNEADAMLSDRGEARAQALVGFFTNAPARLDLGSPAALYACRVSKAGRGRRPRDTLLPLAGTLGLHIRTPYRAEDYESLASTVLRDESLEGKTVVICWTHSELPSLARALGIKPPVDPWKNRVYDRVWIIRYGGAEPRVEDVPQRLLPGDSTR